MDIFGCTTACKTNSSIYNLLRLHLFSFLGHYPFDFRIYHICCIQIIIWFHRFYIWWKSFLNVPSGPTNLDTVSIIFLQISALLLRFLEYRTGIDFLVIVPTCFWANKFYLLAHAFIVTGNLHQCQIWQLSIYVN